MLSPRTMTVTTVSTESAAKAKVPQNSVELQISLAVVGSKLYMVPLTVGEGMVVEAHGALEPCLW